MDKTHSVINELLVDVFNDILAIEQNVIKTGQFSDLTITEVHTIEAISIKEPRSMGEVAKDLKITVGTLTTAVNNLVKKGYVERVRSEEDRRVVTVSLTHKGKVLYKLHLRFHLEMVRETIKGLNDNEEKILINSLEQLSLFFKKKYQNLVNKE